MTVATTAELVKVARRTRTFVTDPAKLWSVRHDPEHDVLQGVRIHAPDVIDYFGAPALLAAALTTGTVCRWCQALERAATAGTRLPAVDAGRTRAGRAPKIRPPIRHRLSPQEPRTQLLPAPAMAAGGHLMSADLTGRTLAA